MASIIATTTPPLDLDEFLALVDQGLDKNQLAEKLGVTFSCVSHFAKRHRIPITTKAHKKGRTDLSEEMICFRCKAFARSLKIENGLTVRQGSPEELAEFGGLATR